MAAAAPTLDWERQLAAQGYAVVAGCDEVGRGSLAGPVSVGVVIIRPETAVELPGVKDSKLLRPAVREALIPDILAWADASAVGHAAAHEIDSLGLVSALRLAGMRALTQAAGTLVPDFVILDVRTPAEYGDGRIAGAYMIDYRSPGFKEDVGKLDRGRTYLVYCRVGNRSGSAVKLMNEMAFRRIYHLEGGITRWKDEGLPTAK